MLIHGSLGVAHISYEVMCKECSSMTVNMAHSCLGEAEATLISIGWKKIVGEWYCETCAKKHPESEMHTGAELIERERMRQIAEKGYTAAHDDRLNRFQLSNAATCYLNPSDAKLFRLHWPFELSYWKPEDKISNLVKAGALIAAEIDRLQRMDKNHG